ncbi:50S ribosomal protein L15 [archaeon HR06]|nr:50S ribosomal protein L15 [archaeon HR06]
MNLLRLKLIKFLKKKSKENDAPIWMSVAKFLERPRIVNVGKISRLTKDGDLVIVPGKVLGGGSINHNVIVGAYNFSEKARRKINEAGGKALSLEEFINLYPKGSRVLVIGG